MNIFLIKLDMSNVILLMLKCTKGERNYSSVELSDIAFSILCLKIGLR